MVLTANNLNELLLDSKKSEYTLIINMVAKLSIDKYSNNNNNNNNNNNSNNNGNTNSNRFIYNSKK